MDHRTNIPGSQPHLPPLGHSTQAATGSSTSRRRSHSQPVAPAVLPHLANPYAGNLRSTDQFDFESFLHQVPSGLSLEGYDEDLFAQLSTMSDEQLRQLPAAPPTSAYQPPQAPPHLPALQEHMQEHGHPQAPNPLLTQTFLAWLQYMHLQNQLSHSGPGVPQQLQQAHAQQTHHQQMPFTFGGLQQQSAYPPTLHLDVSVPHAGPSQPHQRRASTTQQTPESPPSETNDPETDQVVTEDKRRRNTAASARFRVKKKQWTLNLERSITDLSGRVEELEREAAELRRENGWLKEIVMLKSKRFGSGASSSEQPGSSEELQPPQRDDVDNGDGENASDGRNNNTAPDVGKGKGRDVS